MCLKCGAKVFFLGNVYQPIYWYRLEEGDQARQEKEGKWNQVYYVYHSRFMSCCPAEAWSRPQSNRRQLRPRGGWCTARALPQREVGYWVSLTLLGACRSALPSLQSIFSRWSCSAPSFDVKLVEGSASSRRMLRFNITSANIFVGHFLQSGQVHRHYLGQHPGCYPGWEAGIYYLFLFPGWHNLPKNAFSVGFRKSSRTSSNGNSLTSHTG